MTSSPSWNSSRYRRVASLAGANPPPGTTTPPPPPRAPARHPPPQPHPPRRRLRLPRPHHVVARRQHVGERRAAGGRAHRRLATARGLLGREGHGDAHRRPVREREQERRLGEARFAPEVLRERRR